MKDNYDIDADNRRFESIFGEALGDKPSKEETEQAWQSFVAKKRSANRIKAIYWSVSTVAAIVLLAVLFLKPPVDNGVHEFQVYASLETPAKIEIMEQDGMITVSTPPEETTTVRLSDGTEVRLNASSRLAYPTQFAHNERHVELTGEAQFSVAKDVERPFVVRSEGLETTVLGTRFNVKAYPQSRPSVSLFQGKVQVKVKDKKEVVLTPGEELIVDDDDNIQLANGEEREKGWIRNEFVFDNVSLKEVMQEIGAWYNVDIVCYSEPLMKERVHFRINRKVRYEDVVSLLNDIQIAHFEVKNGRIEVAELASAK